MTRRAALHLALLILLSVCATSPFASLAQAPVPDSPAIEHRIDTMLQKLTHRGKDSAHRWHRQLLHLCRAQHWAAPAQDVRRAARRTHLGANTAYPAGVALAATWDPKLVEREGVSLGQDARARGVNFLLGPGVNIYRAPMNGRNFEYLGEDPYLAAHMDVAYIDGVQSQGVCATVKHFAANNSEYDRHNINTLVDERTLHELYLPAFQAAVEQGHVCAVMDSYNLVNGEHSTQNKILNIDILKKEWGFKGVLMSDWDATYDGVAAANGGLDLEMPMPKR